MKPNRLVYPDLLRLLAAFAVLLIHVTSVGLGADNVNGSTVWTSSLVINSLCRWAIPVFFMVSGMLFLNPEKEFKLSRFFKINVFRLVLCIVIWGFFYSLLDQYVFSVLSLKSIVVALYGIVTGNTGYHLWFLYDLLMLYILVPILRILVKHATKKQLEYLLIVWFVFSIFVGQFNDAMQVLLPSLSLTLPYVLTAFTGYAGFFVLGYYLHTYPVPREYSRFIYIAGICSVVLMPIANVLLSLHWEVTNVGFIHQPLGIGSCLIAIALFVMLRQCDYSKLSINTKARIEWFGNRTFGVYLVHVFFMYLFFHIWNISLEFVWPPVAIVLIGVLVAVLSLIVSTLFSKIPILKKII